MVRSIKGNSRVLVYTQGLAILRILVSPGRKVLHAWKLLSGFSLHSFHRLYMLFVYGYHIHEAYSKWDLTKLLYRGTKFTPFSDTNDLLMTAIILLALLILMLIFVRKQVYHRKLHQDHFLPQ